MAELLKRYYPKNVDVHNYVAGNSVAKKIDNWSTLNRKVLSKMDMKLGKDVINQLANSQSGVIEKVLADLRAKIMKDSIADRDAMYSNQSNRNQGEFHPYDQINISNKLFLFLRFHEFLFSIHIFAISIYEHDVISNHYEYIITYD